jgi:protein TonB
LDLAPPMQQDVPQLATPDSFVQKIQPPPPENVAIAANMNIVPEVRDPNMFRGMKVFDISMLDVTPSAKFQARPQYPFEMRRAGIAGEVVVDFIVDTNGDVQNAFALRSSQREFEAAAVQAVMKWKFKPGRKGGRDVPTHMQVPIVFTLNEE